ncbi:nitroreductase family deazaflavin-dependent oxidoreductase [Actinacidiphila sp. ITFR-21]|uniref:nitroreductase family deazaflavin-dependent oxidoreductase n=1 Tax=Actinacidiphila sp. ITFR-21 TaxID=3075199 RepID=UPI00288B89F3|nr:nitroreductase family deazaflavin-dependent oxidoreductase [Streptomyces sp. ITFR-21]WNI15072.1 nitroreductase family deazaflavin-dependent oxidoreductase [Streptomyces sp. ITFR-21]
MTRMDAMRERALDSRPAVAISRRVLPRADVLLQRLSHGRWSASAATGVRVALLTTTGRRSGLPRVAPVTYVEYDGAYFVVGSNWTRDVDPAWSFNLTADPAAWLELRGRRFPVTARGIVGAERERVWPRLVERWPLYGSSARRTARELPVFRLDPVERG